MPGDELHDEAPRAASGPRHAAPRKPRLTRYVPRGRAVAIAAMPTAVLMSMGLTPQLAAANPQSENPFSDAPCVSTADQESEEKAQQEQREEAQDSAAQKAADEAAAVAKERTEAKERAEDARRKAAQKARAAAEKRKQAAAEKERRAEEEGQAEDAGRQEEAPEGSQGTEPEPEPSPSETQRNPWDPLGLGDALKDLFGGGDDEEADDEEAEEPAAQKPAPEKPATEKQAAQDRSTSPEDQSGQGVRDGAERLTEGVKDTVDKVGEAADDARESAEEAARGEDGQRAEDEAGDAKDEAATPSAGETDAEGKKRIPCVEEKKSAGTDEQTPVVLPDAPWHLESSVLTLRGLKYHGVANVTTVTGRTKQVLKFTADSVDIGDLHQTVNGPNGVKYHAQAGKGTTSTIRGGTVTMYTELLEGNLFGVIPQKYDAEHPPPLDVPFAIFTQVKIEQAGQFGGNLTIPGLKMSIATN